MKSQNTLSTGIQTRIFIGFLQKSELKMHLGQSINWQRSKSINEGDLVEIRKNNQDYIGVWVDSPVSYDALKKMEVEVKSRLQLYCPKFKLDTHHLHLFAQIFLN